MDKYEVWATQGQGGDHIKTFETLNKSLNYIWKHAGEASFGIILPNGEWFDQWPKKFEEKFKEVMRLNAEHGRMKEKFCRSDNPDMMCPECNCWKQARAYSS